MRDNSDAALALPADSPKAIIPTITNVKHLYSRVNGFFDVSGNIFTKQENMSFVKLYPNISNLNFFAKYEKYNLIHFGMLNIV